MEKTALEAHNWALIFGGKVASTHPQAAVALKPTFRRQFLLFFTKMLVAYLCTDKFGRPRSSGRGDSSRDDQEIARDDGDTQRLFHIPAFEI